jgi:hypothetical protein
MAVYIQLTNITSGNVESFYVIDNKMRLYFGAECSETEWYHNWYNTVAFSLSLGHTWDQVSKDWPSKKNIIDWLMNNYTAYSYCSR